jgi:hypothetical protein
VKSPVGKSVAFVIVPLFLSIPLPQKSEAPKNDRILFAVWGPQQGKQPGTFVLDPIARIRGATFTEPLPEGKDREAASDNFEKIYFIPGRTYSLLFGGNKFGSITVEKAEAVGCEGQTATAKASRPTPLGLDALAVTTLKGIRTHDNWRHVASEEQRSAFVRLANDYLKGHGAGTFTLEKLKIPSLRATRLKLGGPDTLIGNVILAEKTKIHDLFLVIEFQLGKTQPIIASYHVSNDPEDRTDRQQEKFLDQVDLDGDGTDEIVTMSGYYESWDYAIYREQNGQWKLAYRGGGGGC